MHHTLSFGFTAVFFAVIFKILPDHPVEWQDVWLGAAITALLFSVGKQLFALYLGKATFGSTYGAAASLVVLLVWVDYSAMLFFFGAEFTKVYARRFDATAITPSDDVAAAVPAGESLKRVRRLNRAGR